MDASSLRKRYPSVERKDRRVGQYANYSLEDTAKIGYFDYYKSVASKKVKDLVNKSQYYLPIYDSYTLKITKLTEENENIKEMVNSNRSRSPIRWAQRALDKNQKDINELDEERKKYDLLFPLARALNEEESNQSQIDAICRKYETQNLE